MCSFSSVTLVDGSISSVQGIRLANATPSLSLLSVLCVLNFLFRLLSISQFTGILNCSIKFYPTFCEFKKLRTKMIEIGHEKDGLYFLIWSPN